MVAHRPQRLFQIAEVERLDCCLIFEHSRVVTWLIRPLTLALVSSRCLSSEVSVERERPVGVDHLEQIVLD